jgi:hypothetical protein
MTEFICPFKSTGDILFKEWDEEEYPPGSVHTHSPGGLKQLGIKCSGELCELWLPDRSGGMCCFRKAAEVLEEYLKRSCKCKDD